MAGESATPFRTVIGLEVHVQLQTRTKLFAVVALSLGDQLTHPLAQYVLGCLACFP